MIQIKKRNPLYIRFALSILRKKKSRKNIYTNVFNKPLLINDSKWFPHMFHDIWVDEAYYFQSENKKPYIIDCGANIGVSVLYWYYLFPHAEVVAFEADPEIVKVLTENIARFELPATVIPKAVWTQETKLSFCPDHSIGGRIVDPLIVKNAYIIDTVRLKPYLNRHVDMLKIDIEGVELDVLRDCSSQLMNVERLFVEYHGRGDEKQALPELLEILTEAGFRYHIKQANPVAHPFILREYRKRHDLQLNIYAVRRS